MVPDKKKTKMVSFISGATRNTSIWLKNHRHSYAVSVSPDKLDIKKKSAESGVEPAGIKSHKFLIELKKNPFCNI